MKYPAWNLTAILLLLLGLRPLRDSPRPTWYQKIHPLGLCCSLLQIGMTVFTYLEENKRVAYYSSSANNIMFGLVELKRLLAILVPLGIILLILYDHRRLLVYLEKLQRLDIFLRSPERRQEVVFNCDLERSDQRMRRVNFWTAVLVLALEAINLVTGIIYIVYGRRMALPPWSSFFSYQNLLVVYAAITLKICAQLYGLGLRQDLFCVFLQSVSDLGCPSVKQQKEGRRQRLLLLLKE